MRPALLADPPLGPSGDEGRAALRRELVRPEYHDRNLLEQVLDWVRRQVDSGLDRASEAPPLSTLMAMVVLVGLVSAIAWLASRARRTARERRPDAAVLTGEVVTADELRARARAAFETGRYEDAVVDGFRAAALRQVERGRLVDNPGATAHEVAESLATEQPPLADRVRAAALLFDQVRYGDRTATRDQAEAVLTLDGALAGRR